MTKPRDTEILIAQDITDELFAIVMLTSKPPSLAAFAHALGAACEKHGFVPDEAAGSRIWFSVVNDIGERRRAADRLNRAIVASTSDVLDRRRRQI